MIQLLKLLADSLLSSVFFITVHPIGLPDIVIPATNGMSITVEATTNLVDWTNVNINLVSEIFTNGYITEVLPDTWHYITNTTPTTNIWSQWNNQGYWITETNDQPVTEMTLIIDTWKTNITPKIEWRAVKQPSTNLPYMFLRLRSNG